MVTGDGDELEHGVAVGLGDEVLHRGVLAGGEIGSGWRGEDDVAFEDGPGFCGGNLPDEVITRGESAPQGDCAGGAGVVHPGHRAVGETNQRLPSCSTIATGLVRGRPSYGLGR